MNKNQKIAVVLCVLGMSHAILPSNVAKMRAMFESQQQLPSQKQNITAPKETGRVAAIAAQLDENERLAAQEKALWEMMRQFREQRRLDRMNAKASMALEQEVVIDQSRVLELLAFFGMDPKSSLDPMIFDYLETSSQVEIDMLLNEYQKIRQWARELGVDVSGVVSALSDIVISYPNLPTTELEQRRSRFNELQRRIVNNYVNNVVYYGHLRAFMQTLFVLKYLWTVKNAL